jgi:hypothetical protein
MMQPDLTLIRTRRSDADRLDPSSPTGMGSLGTSVETVAALSLGERLLLALGIQIACLVIRAAELLPGEGAPSGRRALRPGATRSGR